MAEKFIGELNDVLVAGLPQDRIESVSQTLEQSGLDLDAFSGDHNTLSWAREVAARTVQQSVSEWPYAMNEVYRELEGVEDGFKQLEIPEIEAVHIGIVLPNPRYRPPTFVRGRPGDRVRDNTIYSGRRRFFTIEEEALRALDTPKRREAYPADIAQMTLGFLLREVDVKVIHTESETATS
jgi:hypothetical protein